MEGRAQTEGRRSGQSLDVTHNKTRTSTANPPGYAGDEAGERGKEKEKNRDNQIIDNLAAITSNKPGFVPLLVNGRGLKSINQFYNKRKAELQSILGSDSELSDNDSVTLTIVETVIWLPNKPEATIYHWPRGKRALWQVKSLP